LASKDIHVPELGSFKDVAVIDVLVKPGDSVQVDTPLITLETDKATMDVPSDAAGVVDKLHVSKGAQVSAGSLIATLTVSEPATASAAAAAPAASVSPPTTAAATPAAGAPRAAPAITPSAPAASAPAAPAPLAPAPSVSAALARAPVDEARFATTHASPSVRRFARELGVDLGRVSGSGQKGRITEEDVKRFVKSVIAAQGSAGGGLPKISVPDFSQFGPIDVQPLNRVQRISGPRLQASWVNLPHVTQFDEADITELEQLRQELKSKVEGTRVKLTPLAFLVRACVRALQKYPLFNSSLDESGENLIYKRYMHIGFAADTRNGLLVPVIRDANRKDIYEIARLLAELAEKARLGKLSAAEMQGGSFTISSLGGIGGTAFTPIINAPEVAILGVSRAVMRPLFRDGGFVPRLMLPLSLSYDHRVIDGANGARFTNYLASVLSEPRSLLEAVP
jgi:pyruvate dehydrogenase E2 component (dihydrolipoamide acetyltransferase)